MTENIPRIISWNTTYKCNLKCNHCYVDANKNECLELNTKQGKLLINQIAEISKPILVLSGGEPLLREDIFELAKYGTSQGLKMTLGTNGTLITNKVAKKIIAAGIKTLAISLDSSSPKIHDEFRGVKGAWQRTLKGIEACIQNGLDVQFNITVIQQNYEDIKNIFSLAESYNIQNAHLFFLVSTGRGKYVKDISSELYEKMLRYVFKWNSKNNLQVKPTCAPQFMRIAKQLNIKNSRWSRGCIAGISYCRVTPDGSITPCPYLPVNLGNIKDFSFKDIWFSSELLQDLRNHEDNLKGKCGICEYRKICGGCRARAAGLYDNTLTLDEKTIDYSLVKQGLFSADPWCEHSPRMLVK